MEIVINTLFAFIFMSLFLKLSFWKWWLTIVYGLIVGGFVLYIYPFSTEQSQLTFNAILNSPKTMGDMAVFVIVEATIMIWFVIALFLKSKKIEKIVKILNFYPGLLVLPILFYLLTQSMFTFTGVDFSTIAWSLFGAVIVGIPLFSVGTRWLFPEEEQRQEILLIVNVFIIILGLIATANGKMTYMNESGDLELTKIIVAMTLFVTLFGIGFILHKVKWILSNRKLNK